MAYKNLTDSEIQEIAAAYYDERKDHAHAQVTPRHVLVGGQPGAGKSAAAAPIRAELAKQGGYIHVDADRMRERIPTAGTKPTSQETQQDAGKLVSRLRELAIEGKRNIVEEGTFASLSAAFIADKQQRGYAVELVAVATPREQSLLGIHERFELQHAHGAPNPRFVPAEYHDTAMLGFEKTLATHAATLDRVRVIDRAGATLYDSASGKGNALEALAEGQRMTDAKLAGTLKAWQDIDAAAQGRNAPADYLAAIREHQERVDEMQKSRIHDFSMSQLDANTKTLAADPRFAAHTGDELLKAGYFRGFHEKAGEFKGRAPDFQTYDGFVADKANLAQLPAVADLRGMAFERERPQHARDIDGQSL